MTCFYSSIGSPGGSHWCGSSAPSDWRALIVGLAGSFAAQGQQSLVGREPRSSTAPETNSTRNDGPWTLYQAHQPTGAPETHDDPSAAYQPICDAAGAAFGVDPYLLRALVMMESDGNPRAVSAGGTRAGLTMLPVPMALAEGVTNRFDPTQSIWGAARFLRQSYDIFGDPKLALFAYFGGSNPQAWTRDTYAHVTDVEMAYLALRPRATSPIPDQPPAKQETPASLSGSGFFIAEDGRVLTNAHVVKGCERIEVSSPAGVSWGHLLARDATNDLALISTTLHPSAAAVWRSRVKQGEEIAIYGFPLIDLLTNNGSITTGIIAALAGPADDSRFLQITAPVQPGNSGGPVLDRYGNVVGIVTAKLDALTVARITNDIPENVGFAIKESVVQRFLAAVSGIPKRDPATTPLPMPDIAAKARAFTVHIECYQP